MKKTFTLLMVPLLLGTSFVLAQTNLDNNVSLKEFDPYLSEYFKPMAKGIAVSMGSGWTHTAEVHSTLGFDVTFSVALIKIPEADASFKSSDVSTMVNDGIYFSQGTQSTQNGDIITVPNIRTEGDINNETTYMSKQLAGLDIGGISYTPEAIDFMALSGLSAKHAGSASLQLGFGLPKGTDIMIRYFPDVSGLVNKSFGTTDLEMMKTNLWGFGIKHDIKQWIPVLEKIPFLQISALFTYSSFNTGFSGDMLRVDPDRFGDDLIYTDPIMYPNTTWDNQQFAMNVSSFTGGLLIGASIPVFQPYIGLGFNSGNFAATMEGIYPIVALNESYDPLLTGDPAIVDPNEPNSYLLYVEDVEEDPVDLEGNATQFNFQAGARLKLGFFVLHYQYTIQEYSMHSGGIAVTFR